MNTTQLPVKRPLNLDYILSLVVSLILALASLAGLLFQSAIYPTEELVQSGVTNDVVNLIIGLPVLLGSMALARRGRLIGLLFWPGALFMVAYNSAAYAIAMPFTLPFVVNLVLLVLSVLIITRLLSGMDLAAIQQRIQGAVPERLAGGVLVVFGFLFFFWGLIVLVQTFTGQAALSRPELATRVVDLLITPPFVVGGVMLWQRRAFGYAAGAGLLFQASMLFIGLLIYFVLQPFLTPVPFPAGDFVAVLVMGLICFIPFGLFVRGVLARK